MLCQELEYYGPGTFQQQLDKAYKDFNRFSRSNKMDQSQPPFKESKVPWYWLSYQVQLDMFSSRGWQKR